MYVNFKKKIFIPRTSEAGYVPSDMGPGELFVNTKDQRMWVGTDLGPVEVQLDTRKYRADKILRKSG